MVYIDDLTINFFMEIYCMMRYESSEHGQKKTYYHKNTLTERLQDAKTHPFETDSLKLQKYLADKLQNQIFKTSGEIKISVLIDTTGKALCEWIDNNSNFKINKDKMNLLIDSMPNWNCGIQNGYKVNCVELIVLTFNRETLEVTYQLGRD